MAQSGGRINGTAVAAATVGGVLIYAALRNVTPTQALRDILSGKPAGVPDTAGTHLFQDAGSAAYAATTKAVQQQQTAAGAHPDIASAARKYLGIPYRWGGATPAGFDCSGLVTWVLVHDIGLTNLPSLTHTVTGQFLFWRGAQTVSGPPLPGDLICWTGHIAIASGNGMMIEAPHIGANVREVKQRLAGATIRRVIIADKSAGIPSTKQGGTAF